MTKRLILLAALAVVVAAGCIRVDFTIDVQEDGTGTMEGITAFDFESFGSLLEDFGEGAGIPGQGDLCAEFENDLGIDEGEFDEVQPYNEDGFCGVQFKTNFDADEFDTVVGGVNTGGGTIERRGDGWYFELPLDESDFDTSDAEILPGFDDILGDAAYIVRVRLPGEQVEHNGEIDGEGFVVWDVDVTNPPEKLFLRTEPGETQTGDANVAEGGGSDDGGSAVGVVIIVLLVLGGLGVAAYFLMRSRSGSADDSPDAGPTDTAPLAPPVDPNAPPQDFTGPTTADSATTAAAAGMAAAGSSPEPASEPSDTAEVTPAEPGPATESASAPAGETSSNDPKVIASPTPEQATGEPVWDPVRRKYVQWDPTKGHWLTFDDATQSWGPES